MFFFSWLRAQVKAAVLAGLADAAAELGEGQDPAKAVEALRQRLEALPAPAEGKPQVEPIAEGNGCAEPVGAGRRRKRGE